MKIISLDRKFSVSSQLQPDDLAYLVVAGFGTIVNNRPDGEEPGQPTSSDLHAIAKHLGLRYDYLPIVPGRMTDADARMLNMILAGTQRPVLGFCRSGARSTSLWERSRELAAAGG
jgi:sulfide:quinone oxidoreductase